MNLLPNGKVMVCGGWYQTTVYTSTELFDPATGNWSSTASMNVKRYAATSTVLPNGRVLVAGGADESGFDTLPVGSTEVYDSAADSFANTGLLRTARSSLGESGDAAG